ncbi:family 5 glycoside hydrolase, partial [Cryphonectria parasitica EP155]
NGPFKTADSWIIAADGSKVSYAGVNWPGAEMTMVPEGLQYQSIETIVTRIQSLGMNSIRLTYATEMIDQIYENDMADIPIVTAFTSALGVENGTEIFNQVVANNPSFNNETTRLQVYDAIAAECAKHDIFVHLDNHVSRASWCCDPFDGNTWWNDAYFSPSNWTRGLSYMATHGKQWPNLMSMSLYNELRPPFSESNPDLLEAYTWEVWYEQIKRGATAISLAHPDVLIFLSGLGGDTDLRPVVSGEPLEPGTAPFDLADFAGSEDKLVLELHSYDIVSPVTDCPSYHEGLVEAGYSAAQRSDDGKKSSRNGNSTATNRFPVIMTEWGFTQDATTWKDGMYAKCVQKFLGEEFPGTGWMIWVIGGSYYTRQDKQDADESWGLLNHDWSDWRSPEFIEGGLKPLVRKTL